MKKFFATLSVIVLGILILRFTHFTVYAQQPASLPNAQAAQTLSAQVRDTRNKLTPIMREIQFITTDLNNIKRALEQSKGPLTQLAQVVDSVQKEEDRFRTSVATARQNMANAQRILKEVREKSLSISSEARQRAAEATRLARSTDEIYRTNNLAKKLEAVIKLGESLLTTMQNQLNKVEVISAGFGK